MLKFAKSKLWLVILVTIAWVLGTILQPHADRFLTRSLPREPIETPDITPDAIVLGQVDGKKSVAVSAIGAWQPQHVAPDTQCELFRVEIHNKDADPCTILDLRLKIKEKPGTHLEKLTIHLGPHDNPQRWDAFQDKENKDIWHTPWLDDIPLPPGYMFQCSAWGTVARNKPK